MCMANCMVKLLGGIDKYLSALIVFITINYITEILLAIVGEERYSKMFLFKNILKKVAIFILVVVSNVVGTIIESNCAIRTTVILFYISNEGLAILKNIKRFEVPLPRILIELLDRIENGK